MMPPVVPPVVDDHVMHALVQAARAARERAYAPYSKFLVGAALLDDHGRLHAGCNIENAAYPQSQCAEASAIAHLVLTGGRRILAAAVVGVAAEPVTPCGGCRQRLREFDVSETETNRLHGPVGLNLGGKTPPEIAMSIVAEMTAVRRGAPLGGLVDWSGSASACAAAASR